MNEKKLSETFTYIADFIKSMKVKAGVSPGEKFDIIFMREDEGTLLLSGEDAFHYLKSLGNLLECVDETKFSRKAIESYLQDAIFYMVDVNKKRQDIQFENRIDQAINNLRKALSKKPNKYKIYYPVCGLSNENLPIQVGKVLFCIFDDDHKKEFLIPYPNQKNIEEIENSKDSRSQINSMVENSDIINKTVGLIEISTNDTDAAESSAIRELDLTINIINFLGSQIAYNTDGKVNSSYIYLPGEKQSLLVNIPAIEVGGKSSREFAFKRVGPLADFSFGKLLETDKIKALNLERINTLLLDDKRNCLEQRLISAMNWLGQAVVEQNSELAFLYYAISLETLLLLDCKRSELLNRLGLRVAHLLGKNIDERRNIKKAISNLYNTRSAIVHDGKYQVTNAELKLIKYFAQKCILRILRDEPFKKMDDKDLLNWFDDRTLCSNEDTL